MFLHAAREGVFSRDLPSSKRELIFFPLFSEALPILLYLERSYLTSENIIHRLTRAHYFSY